MSVKLVQTLTVLSSQNEQSAVQNMTIASASTVTSREFRELAAFTQGLFFLDVSAISGTTPTLDVTIEQQDPLSLKWVTCVTFAQQTTANGTQSLTIPAQTIELNAVNYRAKYVVGGTGPSVTFTCSVIARTPETIV